MLTVLLKDGTSYSLHTGSPKYAKDLRQKIDDVVQLIADEDELRWIAHEYPALTPTTLLRSVVWYGCLAQTIAANFAKYNIR